MSDCEEVPVEVQEWADSHGFEVEDTGACTHVLHRASADGDILITAAEENLRGPKTVFEPVVVGFHRHGFCAVTFKVAGLYYLWKANITPGRVDEKAR